MRLSIRYITILLLLTILLMLIIVMTICDIREFISRSTYYSLDNFKFWTILSFLETKSRKEGILSIYTDISQKHSEISIYLWSLNTRL